MVTIQGIRRRDFKKAQRFAIEGMHLHWYVEKGFILNLYSRYFWHMELNRATNVYGAYVNGRFSGVLLADMKGKPKPYRRLWRSLFVKAITMLQRLVAGKSTDLYDKANRDMLAAFCRQADPDGEIVFLAADPACPVKGVGTALLSALETDEKGKCIYLFTDSACTYPFYEHRGFVRAQERDIVLKLKDKTVPLMCMLYSKTL